MRDQHTIQILRHLKTKDSISPMEALEEYGCYRLAARIYDLRSAGHNIVTNQSSDGMARYQLRK